jgi:hypothetical protein
LPITSFLAVRRSGHDTKGRGGALFQLNNISDAIQPDLSEDMQKRKDGLASIPDSEPINPMVPKKPTRKKKVRGYSLFIYHLMI